MWTVTSTKRILKWKPGTWKVFNNIILTEIQDITICSSQLMHWKDWNSGLTKPSIARKAEYVNFSYNASGNVMVHSIRRQLAIVYKIFKNYICPNYSTLSFSPEQNRNLCLYKDLYVSAHSSIIYNRPKPKGRKCQSTS